METYLVGGAVRDKLMGIPVTERDWVVVGATPQEMLARGFQPVGKDFPVFLHPQTHEEYALARTERKVGRGYKGFTFYSAPDVSLIADLKRRDLTINAIAQSETGELIDPYNGQIDIQNRVLRHVSEAFQEDPVRILRVARFAAKFPDFTIYPSTYQLMQIMVKNGEVNALVSERVWQEFRRALETNMPQRFFLVLHEAHALPILFPEIRFSEMAFTALQEAIQLTPEPTVRFASILHNLEAVTLESLCQRYPIPRDYTELALLTLRWHSTYRQLSPYLTSSEEILDLLKAVDARRRPERFQNFLLACEASTLFSNSIASKLLLACAQAIKNINIKSLQTQKLTSLAFSAAVEQMQLAAIRDHLIRN